MTITGLQENIGRWLEEQRVKITGRVTAFQVEVPPSPLGWVRIEDRLPELGEIVWLWEQGRGPWIGSRGDPDSEGWLWGNAYGSMWHNGAKWDADVEQDDEYKPTHWQPLPLLPNVKDEPTRK